MLRFFRGGGRLDALWQHMDMLDLLGRCHVVRDLVLTPALRGVEILSGLKVLRSSEVFMSETYTSPNHATGFSVAWRQDGAYVARVIDVDRPYHFVLWCPYCRMYTVVLRGDRRPKVYRLVDAVAVLLFTGGGGTKCPNTNIRR